MSVLLFFVAAQFMFLGLIGEYIGRLYIESKQRPLFIIEDVIASGRSVSTGQSRTAAEAQS
jgi:polyisoprenyl-phosphate glycosyltransferase